MLETESEKIVLSQARGDKVFCDAYRSIANEIGSLFVVAEIEMKQETAQKIFEIITAVLEKENERVLTNKRSGEKIDYEDEFEKILNKVNSALATLASEGYTDWINKMHVAVAAVWHNKLWLSGTGRVQIYLMRHDNLADIGSKISSKGSTPMKTFTSTINGQMNDEDQLLITTPRLLESLPREEIEVGLQKYPPAEFANHIKNKLADSSYSLSSMVIRVQEERDKPDDLQINFADVPTDISSERDEKVVDSSSAGADLDNNDSREDNTLEDKISFPDLEGEATNKDDNNQTSKEPSSEKPKFSFSTVIKKIAATGEKSKDIIKSVGQKVKSRSVKNAGRRRPSSLEQSKTPLGTSIGSNISGLAKKTSRGALNKFYDLPRSSQILAIAFLILAILFIGSVIINSQRKKQINELSQNEILLEKALNKEKEASDALIYQDRERAQELLTEAKNEANKLIEGGILVEEAENLITRIDDQLDKAQGITRIDNAIQLAELDKKSITELIGVNDKIYVFDKKTNLIYSLDEADKELTAVSNESSNLGRFQLATSDNDESAIYLLTDSPALVEFDTSQKILTEIDIDIFNADDITKDLAQFGGNIYRLVPEAKQILKHTSTIAGYSKGTDWIITNTDELEKAQSLTIDGYIYVLLSDGRVNKYLRGQKQNFDLADISTPMDNPSQIITSTLSSNLYIVDQNNERILAFNKNNGSLVAQFKSDQFGTIQDIFVDQEEKKMYVLTDNKIFGVVLDITEE